MAVAVVAACQVMGAGGSLAAGRDERPDEADGGKAVVLYVPVGDADASPRGFGRAQDQQPPYQPHHSRHRGLAP